MKINRPKIAHPDTLLPGMQGAFLTSPFLNDDVNHLYTPRVQKYISMYHLDIGNPGCTDNDEEIPMVAKPKLVIPEIVWPFHQVKLHIAPMCGGHFFVDDDVMMRFIRHPENYIPTLKMCCVVLSLDLSTYQEFRLPIIRHNVYLNAFIPRNFRKTE